MKKLFAAILSFTFVTNTFAFDGFYQTIDDETNKPKSIVALYKYTAIDDGEEDEYLGGRIIALYGEDGKISETINAPVKIATEVKNTPKMAGLDIIWEMEFDDDDNEYDDGNIMDPKSGKVYSSVMWKDSETPNKLQVRGKIGPFGRTQTWNILQVSDLPTDLQNIKTSGWLPKIYK
jgi:hypothetical protein